MSPIYFVISNTFILFMLLFEWLLSYKVSRSKLISYLLLWLMTFVAFVAHPSFKSEDYYLASFYVLMLLSVGMFLFQFYSLYRASTLKNNYHQLFLKSLMDLNRNVFLVTDERDRIREISQSLLSDINKDTKEIIHRKWMDIVHQSLVFQKMNKQPVDNNAVEQYYLKFNATYKSQKDHEIEFEYVNEYGDVQVIHCTERPIIINNNFRGRILVGEKVTTEFMTKTNQEVTLIKHAFQDLQLRFQSTLNLIPDGLYYLDDQKQELWGTDRFRKLVGSENNTIPYEAFLNKIHAGDIEQYKKQMSLKAKKKKYQMNYRLVVNGLDQWVLERGEQIDTSDGPLTVAVLQEASSRNVMNKIPFLDQQDYKLKLKDKIRRNEPFWIVRFDINQVSEMNIKYGREPMEHAINDFLRKLKKMYHTEYSKMYELAQNQYAVVLSRQEDYTIIRKGLLSSSDLFRFEKMMGGIEISFHPSIGIVAYPDNETAYESLVQAAEKAVLVAGKKLNRYHYCFYEDIQDVFE